MSNLVVIEEQFAPEEKELDSTTSSGVAVENRSGDKNICGGSRSNQCETKEVESEEQNWLLISELYDFCSFLRSLLVVFSTKVMKKKSNREKFAILNLLVWLTVYMCLADLKTVRTKKLYSAYKDGLFFESYLDDELPTNFIEINNGSLSVLDECYKAAKVAVIFSYTHWSINSLDSREVFLETARMFDASSDNNDVVFVAINCWLPGRECRNASKGYGPFPRFVIYVPEIGRWVRYGGPVSSTALRSEIDRLLEPYEIVNSVDKFRRKLTSNHFSLVLFPSPASLSPKSLSEYLDELYTLAFRMSHLKHQSYWSTPQMLLVTHPLLKHYLYSVDFIFTHQQTSRLLQYNGAAIYRDQKPVNYIYLNDSSSTGLNQNLWNLLRRVYSPTTSRGVWNNLRSGYVDSSVLSSVPTFHLTSLSSLDNILKRRAHFTFILHSNDADLINSYLMLRYKLENCADRVKGFYCISGTQFYSPQSKESNNRSSEGDEEQDANGDYQTVNYCQLCSKHSHVLSSIYHLFTHHNNSYSFHQYLSSSLARVAQLSCYKSKRDFTSATHMLNEDISFQRSLPQWKSALSSSFPSFNDNLMGLSSCGHNLTLIFAISSQVQSCDNVISFCSNSSYLLVFDHINTQQVYKVPNIVSIEDIVEVVADAVGQSYNLLTSELVRFSKPPKHFIPTAFRSNSGVSKRSEFGDNGSSSVGLNGQIKSGSFSGLKDSSVEKDVSSETAPLSSSSHCKLRDIWSRNNSNHCLVLHYNSWCGFCKTVLHVFHTVRSLMTSAFPNVTEFVQVNSGFDHVPAQHAVSTFPTIVFYPALNTCATVTADFAYRSESSQRFLDNDNSGTRYLNYTFVYPNDVAITVPNLYGFVRLHSGVY